jgi:hypothetical protein
MRPSIDAESVTGGACYAHGSSASNYATDMWSVFFRRLLRVAVGSLQRVIFYYPFSSER